MPRAHLCRAGLKALQAPEVAAVRKLQEQVYLGSAFLVHEPGEEQFPGPGLPGLLDSHGARGAPHLDGCVIAGCQEQLLLHRAEGHRVDHVVVLQLGQADVIVPVPDVAVAIFCPAAADKTAVRTPARQTAFRTERPGPARGPSLHLQGRHPQALTPREANPLCDPGPATDTGGFPEVEPEMRPHSSSSN